MAGDEFSPGSKDSSIWKVICIEVRQAFFGYKVDTYLQRSQVIEYTTRFGRISNAVTQESTVPIVVTNAGKNAKRTLDVLLSTLAVPTVFSVNVHPQCQILNGRRSLTLE